MPLESFDDEEELGEPSPPPPPQKVRTYEIKVLWSTGEEALVGTGDDHDLKAVERAYLAALDLSPAELAAFPRGPSSRTIREHHVVEVFCSETGWVVIPSRGTLPSVREYEKKMSTRVPPQYQTVQLAQNQSASIIPVQTTGQLPQDVLDLHHRYGRETLVVLGDTFDMPAGQEQYLQQICHCIMKTSSGLGGALIARADRSQINVWLEEAYLSLKPSPFFARAGVASAQTTRIPQDIPAYQNDLFLLSGEQPVNDAPWLAALASAYAENRGSLVILLGGSETAWQDVNAQLKEHRRILVIEGTGGVADKLATAVQGQPGDYPVLASYLASGLVRTVPIREEAEFEHILRVVLTSW